MAGGKLAKVFSADAAALVLRLMLAAVFIHHGGAKMFGWFGGNGWQAAIRQQAGMDIPVALAAAAIVTEFVGGCCILVGLLARFWAAGLAVIMLVAIFYVHMHLKGDPVGKLEFQFALLAASLAVVLMGPGRWSLADFEGWILGLRSTPK
jgi:putative oxidoreductase